MEKIKKLFQTTKTKRGTYSIGITAAVVAIVIVFNLIIGQLPEQYRNIDVSSTKIYEITDTSRDFLDKLDKDVDIKVLAVKEESDERISTFVSKYAALSKHLKVEWIDPVLHPSVLNEYDAQEDTIIVSCEDTGKSTQISFDDIIVMDMYSYYYTGSAAESEFDGEGQLTSAVNYVVNDANQKIYRTSGHGESTFSTTINDLMDKNNCTVTEVNLMMQDAVPQDCDLLLMYSPEKDLADSELESIRNYLSGGGNVMILLGETNSTELPNLSSLMLEYGMESVDGYIADTQRCYQGNYYYIFPKLSVSNGLDSGISSEMVLVINTHGMQLTDAQRDTISTSAFMSTSDNSYAVTEDDQTEGNYVLGAVATETVTTASGSKDSEEVSEDEETEEAESRLTVISAGSIIEASITDTFTTLENTTLFMNAVTANFDGVENISIEPKSLAVEYNTVQHAGLFSLAVIIGLPLLIVISGFVVWFRRRRA